MDSYGLYKNARNAAWQTLVDFRVNSLPVSLSIIANQLSIPVAAYPHAASVIESLNLQRLSRQASGMALLVDGQWMICFDPATVPAGRVRFTIAHELGHILQGHKPEALSDRAAILSRINTGDFQAHQRDPQERAADIYAVRLLAPACVLHALGAYTPEAIMQLCGLSRRAAEIRAERMSVLRKRGAWLSHPLERQVNEQFLPFIRAKQ